MDYKQIKNINNKKKGKKNMKEFMKKGISTLPVVNEILFFVLLAHEVIGLAKDWYKTRKSSTENKPEEDPEKK